MNSWAESVQVLLKVSGVGVMAAKGDPFIG